MLEDLGSKAFVVTGSGSGIGRAAAMLLGKAGASIIIADVNVAGGEETASKINSETGGKAHFIRADVSTAEGAEAMVAECLARYGRLDGALNNAGVPQAGKLMHELSVEDWDKCHGINLRGVFLCMRAQVRAMLEGTGGSIVVISSNAAVLGVGRTAEYCASKAGVMGLVRAAAVDYAAQNIRVNGILPGGTMTPMVQASIEQDPNIQSIINTFPMKRLGQPHEIAAGAVFLLSDAASYVTGVGWSIDGGYATI